MSEEFALRVLSLGAGVQSSAVLLMAMEGEISPPLDLAIFGDTGWEAPATYEYFDWLQKHCEGRIPVKRVKTTGTEQYPLSNIRQDALGAKKNTIPFYVRNSDDSIGMLMRKCTREYKINPVMQEVRKTLGLSKGKRVPKGVRVQQWFGISIDEVSRMRTAKDRWIENRYPLIEMDMARSDCLKWITDRGYPEPSRSACIGCPYHSDTEWRAMKQDRPQEFEDAIQFDRSLRSADGVVDVDGECYLHRLAIPLEDVDLSIPEDHGQINMFNAECEGICGC